MTGTAVLFLVLSLLIVWGGLVLSVLRLRRDGRDEQPEDDGTGPGVSARGPG